jgi:hypothetical protein
MPPASVKTPSLWSNISRKNLALFLIAVFFTFAIMGIISDISNMGRSTPLHYALNVLLSGSFAIFYVYAGVTLRRKFWLFFLPFLAFQIFFMTMVARWLPDSKHLNQLNPAETAALTTRLGFDSAAIAIAISIGYSGFVTAFMRETRHHISINKEKAALESEFLAARHIQQLILPQSNETFAGFHVDSVYTPAQQVGGDFFQILSDGAGGILIVIGDVAGKGLSAAMLVSMLVGIVRATAEETHDPARILRKLHDRLLGSAGEGFSTALAAHIAQNGLVTIANAGHLSPYLDGKEIELPGALPLGVSTGGDYQSITFALPPGSRLTFYTDGVVEARNQAGELFGFDRAQAISVSTAAAVTKAAVDFGQEDDITVATIERLPA